MVTVREPTRRDITVGTAPTRARTHIGPLASDDGTYEPVCGRTEERPIPVDDSQFGDRETAEAVARATGKYRSALRRYNPNVPYYDLIVSEYDSRFGLGGATATTEGWVTAGVTSGPPGPPCGLGTDVGGRTECAANGDRSERAEFCHQAAAAVFEVLVDADRRAVKTAVMDACFDLTETISSADDLCPRLLEGMATALHIHLASTEQADVLERAASSLTSRPDAAKTLVATLAEMEWLDFIESYICFMWRFGPDATTRAAELALEDYALSVRKGRPPVLPVALELYRRMSSQRPVSLYVTSTESGWHTALSVSSTSSAVGLASVPIYEHATD